MIAFLRDGRRVVTGTRDGSLHVWDTVTARAFDLPPQGTGVTGLAVSPDGRTFATGTAGGFCRLWDSVSLSQTGHTYKLVSAVTGLAFHPDGRTLAIGQDDGTIRLWDVPLPKAVAAPIRTGSAVHSVSFSSDGRRVLTGGSMGAQWWDTSSGTASGPLMHSKQYEPEGVVPSEDGRRTYNVVDLVEGTALSPDGRTLATARWAGDEIRVRGRAEVWDAATGRRLCQTPEQPLPLTGVAYSPDSRRLLTWDARPGSALLWDTATLQHGRPLLRTLETPVHSAVFSSEGRSLLLACRDGTVRSWDVSTDEEIGADHHPLHGYPVTAVAFDPKGPRVVAGCQAGTVGFWDVTTGVLMHELRGNAGETVAVAYSPDGRILLTASHNGRARFWDVESGRQLGPPLRHTDAVLCVAFHPDGKTVATGTKDGMLHRWHGPALPARGDVKAMRDWVETQTGLKLDDRGAVHASSGPRKSPGH
jgi:WD40 repeat protein